MRMKMPFAMVAVAALAAAVPVVRSDDGKGVPGSKGGGKGQGRHHDRSDTAIAPSRDAKFKDWDRDGNGTLSRDEYPGHPGNFRALDTDNDGALSTEEFHHRSGPTAPPGARSEGTAVKDPSAAPAREDEFRRLDANGDGVLSREEWRGRPSTFDALDANRNGSLSRDEYGDGRARGRQVK